MVTRNRASYRCSTIQLELEKIIDRKNLFDPANPQIVVSDQELEEVLDVSRLQRNQLNQFINRHFESDYPLFSMPEETNQEVRKLIELRRKHKDIAPVTDFDIEGDYKVDPDFQLLIKTVTNANPSQNIFKYREIASAVSAYILLHKEELFDLRNITVVRSNNLLKRVFKVSYFSRSQVTSLMRRSLRFVRRSKRLRK